MFKTQRTAVITLVALVIVLVIAVMLMRANFQSSYENAQGQMQNRALTIEAQMRATP